MQSRLFRTRSRQVILAALAVTIGHSALATDQTTYTYDALGRLQSVQYQSGAQVTYTYDAAGNRTQVTNTGNGSGNTGVLPQQRRKAAIQAILSILLNN